MVVLVEPGGVSTRQLTGGRAGVWSLVTSCWTLSHRGQNRPRGLVIGEGFLVHGEELFVLGMSFLVHSEYLLFFCMRIFYLQTLAEHRTMHLEAFTDGLPPGPNNPPKPRLMIRWICVTRAASPYVTCRRSQ